VGGWGMGVCEEGRLRFSLFLTIYIPAEEKKVTGGGEHNENCQVILLASLACQPGLGFSFFLKILI
jgi:hypothetical protein